MSSGLTKGEIKRQCENQYEAIKTAEEHLVRLRAMCEHEETHETLYQWRVGSIFRANVCSYCGELIENIDANPPF